MTHRTTFALDTDTRDRLKRLASTWNVSLAEVVRRSVRQAEENLGTGADGPLAALDRFFEETQGGIVKEKAESYLAEVREDRRSGWRA